MTHSGSKRGESVSGTALSKGGLIDVAVEKPASGGRMIARHDGRVILVAGAIPGERVRARIERVEKRVAFAAVADVIVPAPSRREPGFEPACGGCLVCPHRLRDPACAQVRNRRRRVHAHWQITACAIGADCPLGRARLPDAGATARARGPHRVLSRRNAPVVRRSGDRPAARLVTGSRPGCAVRAGKSANEVVSVAVAETLPLTNALFTSSSGPLIPCRPLHSMLRLAPPG